MSEPTIKLDQLDSRIRSVWARTQIFHLLAGTLKFFRWAIPLFLLGIFIDWMTYMPAYGRFVILIALLLVSFYQAWRGGWRNLRTFSARHTALQIEAYHGKLNSLLISALQFRDSTKQSGEGNVLHNRTYNLAEEAASNIQPEKAVPYNPLRRSGVTALVLCTVIAVLTVMNSAFMGAGVLRIFCPWVAIEYPTDTQINLEQDELVVKEGDSAVIQAKLNGIVPEDAVILIRTGKGSAREIDLKVSDALCEYSIASASRDFTYCIKAGDDRTKWHKVRVVPAPRVKQVNVEVSFPKYQARKNAVIEALNLTVPEGSRLNWEITLDRPIKSAEFLSDGEDSVSLKVSEDGYKVNFDEVASASSGYNFAWVEKENGFKFTSPRYYLQVSSDQAPRVELTSPESNLIAMIGRPLRLAARFQDDHGLGSAAISYRLNQHDEKIAELNSLPVNGKGEQPIDWDYREAVKELKIGDTLSFSLKVTDRYPGEKGPHAVRSETRRITFLSKEDYLEQIQKKKDLLLSRVQAIYRKQRSAFNNVTNLDPVDETYMQSCQVEAIRQELMREQLKEVSDKMQALLDDLAANNVSDAPEGDSLSHIRKTLLVIADTHLANAASRLRHQSGIVGNDTQESPDPSAAGRVVNTAARELASLVLLKSIDTAQEVYAREARMLAQVQAGLRWRTVQKDSQKDKSLAKEQAELSQWTLRLINDLNKGMRYEKRPLAVLRLIQSIKTLQKAGVVEMMRQAETLVTQAEIEKAQTLQTNLIETLLNAEFSVRLSGSYSTLIKTRDQLREIVKAQTELRGQSGDMPAAKAEEAQKKLRKRLLTLLLPTVPAPRTRLFDETFPNKPQVQKLLKEVDESMVSSIDKFSSGSPAAATQKEAEKKLNHLLNLVDQWAVEMGLQTMGMNTLVAVTGDRLDFIEKYEAKVVSLIEKTDIAISEEKKVGSLVESQSLLTEELAAFNDDLMKQLELKDDKDIPPILSRLKRAEKVMNNALKALKSNEGDKAIGFQEDTADILSEAFAIVTKQNEQLGLLQSLLMFQRSVGFANKYMIDIVSEQKDMLKITEGLDPKDASKVKPQLGNLKRCVEDIAPLLDLVASRLDVGSPLAFAKTDLEDAVISLESGDKLDSVDAQDVAAESLGEVQGLVKAIKSETGYITEIIEHLHVAVADIVLLEYRQQELTHKTQAASMAQVKALLAEQRDLQAKANDTGQKLEIVTGGIPAFSDLIKGKSEKDVELMKEMPAYTLPASLMSKAMTELESGNVEAAVEQMELAGETLKENAESLFASITMLHGLPNIDMSLHTDPAVKRLVDVMSLASAHKILLRTANKAEKDKIKFLSQKQDDLAARCLELSKVGEPHAKLKLAAEQLSISARAIKSADIDASKRSQQAALETLRHFIIEQALILETAVPLAAASEGSPDATSEGSDDEAEFSAGFISDFVSGEAPKDQRSGWKIHADRNRAALNQNFARELPLEYRGLLKNYYERVTK